MEARRRYRRQAWHTIRDLALSPLREGPSSSAGITHTGLALTTVIGVAGLIMIWPISWGLNEIAGAILMRDPVASHISAWAFRSGIDLLGLLITGAMVAAVAHVVRFRAMSAALAVIVMMAIEIAVDRPLMMWLHGPPFAAPFAFGSWFVRWVGGVFGLRIGNISGRPTLTECPLSDPGGPALPAPQPQPARSSDWVRAFLRATLRVDRLPGFGFTAVRPGA
jgi:hypothetical protein